MKLDWNQIFIFTLIILINLVFVNLVFEKVNYLDDIFDSFTKFRLHICFFIFENNQILSYVK